MRITIIGCGRIARRHAGLLKKYFHRVDIAFASRDAAKAEAYAAEFGGVAAFGSYNSALDDPLTRAVILCVPHDLHLPLAEAAAAARKHILLEKPIARNVDEGRRIQQAVQQSGVKLMVAENFHFKPSVRLAQRIMASGEIGEIKAIRINACSFAKHGGWRSQAENMGGGAMIDGGIHWVNTFLELGGPVEAVYAVESHRTLQDLSGDDTIFAVARFRSGAVGTLHHSWAIRGELPFQHTIVHGTVGSMYVENHGYWILTRSQSFRLRIPPLRDRYGHLGLIEEFVRCLETEMMPDYDAEKALRDLEFVEICMRAADGADDADRPSAPSASSAAF